MEAQILHLCALRSSLFKIPRQRWKVDGAIPMRAFSQPAADPVDGPNQFGIFCCAPSAAKRRFNFCSQNLHPALGRVRAWRLKMWLGPQLRPLLPLVNRVFRLRETSLWIEKSLLVQMKRLVCKMLLKLLRPPLISYPLIFVRRRRSSELLLSKHSRPPLRFDIVKSSCFTSQNHKFSFQDVGWDRRPRGAFHKVLFRLRETHISGSERCSKHRRLIRKVSDCSGALARRRALGWPRPLTKSTYHFSLLTLSVKWT